MNPLSVVHAETDRTSPGLLTCLTRRESTNLGADPN